MAKIVRLGEVVVPSGNLLVIDFGLLSMWSGSRSPKLPAGIVSDATTEMANAAVDFQVAGRDWEAAGRALRRSSHPGFVYDVARPWIEQLRSDFDARVREGGLEASLVPTAQRVSHRDRALAAIDHGGGAGELTFHGVWACAVGGLPSRELPVFGERMPSGPDADRWRRVWVQLGDAAPVASSQLVGTVGVDEARLMFGDLAALDDWGHEELLDGLADVVFWGADAPALASELDAASLPTVEDTPSSGVASPERQGWLRRTVGALRSARPRIARSPPQYGWKDLPIDEAVRLGERVDEARDQGRRVAVDFRPHTHHWQLLTQVWNSPFEAGTISLSGAQLFGFMTSWGDGIYEVLLERDAQKRPLRLSVELGTEKIVARQRALERGRSSAGADLSGRR